MNAPATITWMLHDISRRPRRLAALALFVAFGAGAVIAVVDGARRNATALDRSIVAVVPADAIAVPNEPGFDWAPIAQLDIVTELEEFLVLYFGVPELGDGEFGGFPPGSPGAAAEWERPVVLAGRAADQRTADEVTISPDVAALGVDIGDTLTIHLTSWADLFAGVPDPATRDVTVTVVGVTKLSFFSWDVQPTYAFFQANSELLLDGGYVNALVRLAGGADDVAEFERALSAYAGRPIEVMRASESIEGDRKLVAVGTAGLAALTAAGFVAVVLLVGQAVARISASRPDELGVLRQLGMSGRAAAASVLAAPALAVAAGLLVAPLLSHAVSDRFPIGYARHLEPTPGRRIDLVATAGALAALAVAFTVVFAMVAVRLGRPAGVRRNDRTLTAAIWRVRLSVPALLGARLAVTGAVRRRMPELPVIVATGAAGIVAAATFAAGLNDAIDDRRLFGQVFEIGIEIYDEESPIPDVDAFAALAPRGVAVLTNVAASVNGQPVSLMSVEDLLGNSQPLTRRGRGTAADDEIALSPTALRDLGVGIGDTVELDGRHVTVVGETLTPEFGHTAYFAGGTISHTLMAQLVADGATVKNHGIGLDLPPGTDITAAVAQLSRDGALTTVLPDLLQQTALAATRPLPWVFAGFVALLTLGSVANVLMSTARDRTHEVAVLQVLGLTRVQARRTVGWHAAIATVAGVVVGAPIGIALGHTAWRVVADALPAIHRVPHAAPRALLLAGGVVAAGLVVAAWPARRTARVEPALVLRSE